MNQSELKEQAYKTLSKQSVAQLQSKLDSGHFRGLSIEVAKEIIAKRSAKTQDTKIEVDEIEIDEPKIVKTKIVKAKNTKKSAKKLAKKVAVKKSSKKGETKTAMVLKLLKTTKKSIPEIAAQLKCDIGFAYRVKREQS